MLGISGIRKLGNNKTRAVGIVRGLYITTVKGCYFYIDYLSPTHPDRRRRMKLGDCIRYDNSTIKKCLQSAIYLATHCRVDYLDKGQDPLDARNLQKQQMKEEAFIFKSIAKKYIAHHAPGKKKGWRDRIETLLEKHVYGAIGKKPVKEITRNQAASIVNKCQETAPSQAPKVRALCFNIVQMARALGITHDDDNPFDLNQLSHIITKPKEAGKKKHHPRLSEQDAPDLFAYLSQASPSSAKRCVLWIMLTACRSGEARGARWDEINWDDRIWVIPSQRMKMKKEHIVPLSNQAASLLEKQYQITGKRALIFTNTGKELSKPTVNKQFNRACDTLEIKDPDNSQRPVLHGIRSAFRSWAEPLEYSSHIKEQCLSHDSQNAVEASYNRGDNITQRREIMQSWGDYLNSKIDLNR